MKYDFDTPINRYNTGSVKWDLAEHIFGKKKLLPMWVADMDFRSPQPVLDALAERARHGIFGYTACTPSYYEATINWFKKHHNWTIRQEWISYTPGIVPAISLLIQTFTDPGDKVLLQLPVYYPFMEAIRHNGRHPLNNPLQVHKNYYSMDFDDLEKKAADPAARMMILCSPHNPVGRVWTRAELQRVADICRAHDILVVSDEIHCDLVLGDKKHTPFATLSEECERNSITCTSASKTFNLAGLQTANVMIPDPHKRRAFQKSLRRNGISGPNSFGAVALEASYRQGEEWIEQLLGYLRSNLAFLKEYLTANLPRVGIIEPEATYLVWLDFRKYGIDAQQRRRMLLDAGIALDNGFIFGEEDGSGFERINIACPRSILKEGLEKIAAAFAPYTP